MLRASALCIPAWVPSLLLWRGVGAGKWGLKCESRGWQLLTVKGKPGGTGVQICNGGCLKRKPRTPQKHGVIIGWCTSWGKAGTTAPPPPPPTVICVCGPWEGHSFEQDCSHHKPRPPYQPRLQGPERCPCQNLLQSQLWVSWPETGNALFWQGPGGEVWRGDGLWGEDSCWLCGYYGGKGDEGLRSQDAPRGGAVCCWVAWKGLPPRPARPSRLQLPASLCHHRQYTQNSKYNKWVFQKEGITDIIKCYLQKICRTLAAKIYKTNGRTSIQKWVTNEMKSCW